MPKKERLNTKGVVGNPHGIYPIVKDPITQAIREQKERSITLMCKTELKPLTREPKKSVFRARVKECFNP
ncbi:hypothetical protein VN1161_00140 [Helicobacter pylori]|nr:hypothetical protein VN1161_00140 [Helicobacter pylori]